jgi:hypothetical protein
MLKIYFYGNQIQSSRRLERETARNVEMMWLPAERMKMGVKHQVRSLMRCSRFCATSLAARRPKQTHVFPGRSPGKPLSGPALSQTMRRSGGGDYTMHDTTRSGFRDWAADHGVEFDVGEACLAHAVGNSGHPRLFAIDDGRAPPQGHGGLGNVRCGRGRRPDSGSAPAMTVSTDLVF